MNSRHPSFGGDWTRQKLHVLSGYLAAYRKVLQGKGFRTGYLDAFAGTGYRAPRSASEPAPDAQGLLFPDLDDGEPQGFLEGSARLALEVEPPFDRYLFIDLNRRRCDSLDGLKEEFPALADRIQVHNGDANEKIQDLCGRDWRGHRAVLFLDPFGMQVEWTTIQAVAETQAIDMWLLFPFGIGVNRLLPRSGEIPDSWRKRIDNLLGTQDWYDAFYDVAPESSLFGTALPVVAKKSVMEIGKFFLDRLRHTFTGVCNRPGVLVNSKGSPLYLLCFAAGNQKGAPTATRIADHLLRDLS